MTRHFSRSTLIAAGLLSALGLLAGCGAEASTYIDGRFVAARTSAPMSGVSVCRNGDSARLVVAATAFDVDAGRLSWNLNRELPLPQGWKKLELIQSGRLVTVRVDGAVLQTVDPSASATPVAQPIADEMPETEEKTIEDLQAEQQPQDDPIDRMIQDIEQRPIVRLTPDDDR